MIRANVQKVYEFFLKKKLSYQRVFDPNNQFTREVLMDLAKFCRAYQSTFHPDPRVHAVLEGRREVWLRIQEHLQLSTDEIYELHTIKDMNERKRE